MTEAEFATKWGAWFIATRPTFPDSALIEFKVARGGTFNLKQWREKQSHQSRNLHNATIDVGVYHKLSDFSPEQKPADAFFIRNASGVLIIYFVKYKEFFHIQYNDIPDTPSISYEYCCGHFARLRLVSTKKVNSVVAF